MSNPKRDALEQYEKAYKAFKIGHITEGEMLAVRGAALQAERVKDEDLRAIEEKVRKQINVRA